MVLFINLYIKKEKDLYRQTVMSTLELPLRMPHKAEIEPICACYQTQIREYLPTAILKIELSRFWNKKL